MRNERRKDAVEMFLHACAFVYCVEYYEQVEQSAVHKAMWRSTPKIVNTAFACEVFLKTLLVFNDIAYKRAHNLESLYNLLPAEYQQQIEQGLVARYGKTTDVFGIPYVRRISEAFNDWRYSFERTRLSLDISVLRTFCETLRELCCQKMYGESWETIQRRMK